MHLQRVVSEIETNSESDSTYIEKEASEEDASVCFKLGTYTYTTYFKKTGRYSKNSDVISSNFE